MIETLRRLFGEVVSDSLGSVDALTGVACVEVGIAAERDGFGGAMDVGGPAGALGGKANAGALGGAVDSGRNTSAGWVFTVEPWAGTKASAFGAKAVDVKTGFGCGVVGAGGFGCDCGWPKEGTKADAAASKAVAAAEWFGPGVAIRGGVTTGVEIWDVPNGVGFGKAGAGC